MPLKPLNRALMLFGGGSRRESSEIPPLAGFRIFAARIQPVFS